MRQGSLLNWTYIYLCILTWAVDTILGTSLIASLHIDVVVLFLAFIYNIHEGFFKKAFVSGPILIWGLWTLYAIVNWFICPYSELTAEAHAHWYWYIFTLSRTYFLLVLLYYEACINFRRTIKMLAYAFIIYFILGVVGQWNGPMRDEETWEGRNGTILGNHFPLNMLCSLFVVIIAKIYGYISSRQLLTWICCVSFVLLWVATRKAVVGMFILLLFYTISLIKNLSLSNITKLLFFLGLLYMSFMLIMDYTLVGQRFDELSEMYFDELSDYNYEIDVPGWLGFLGDRAIQYVLAWNVFIEHPLNGVGLGNSMDYTELPFPIHSEYMEQLCEGGVLGTSLYLCYIFSIFKCIRNAWEKRSYSATIICLGGMITLLFISFTAWIYNQPCFFVIYALLIAYCNPIRRNRKWRRIELRRRILCLR